MDLRETRILKGLSYLTAPFNKFDGILISYIANYIKDVHLLKMLKMLIYLDIIILFFFSILTFSVHYEPLIIILFLVPIFESNFIDYICNGPTYFILSNISKIMVLFFSKIAITLFIAKG